MVVGKYWCRIVVDGLVGASRGVFGPRFFLFLGITQRVIKEGGGFGQGKERTQR